jgi:hypothetical protein
LQQVALTEIPGGSALRTWLNDNQTPIWSGLSAGDMVQIASGILPKELSIIQQADLVRFPVAATRTAAARNLAQQQELNKETKLIEFLPSMQSKLTREQTRELVLAFWDGTDHFSRLNEWLKPELDIETLLRLLGTRTANDGIDPFSVAVARYVAQSSFSPTIDLLTPLARHPEPLVRAYVYSRLDPQKPQERSIMSQMAQTESNPRLKAQITERLGEL